ncbi:DUF2231 domain-containing protein [Paenibacillus cymbidii]|uniref:DUF2231 domain-containing protein n=1 Tax=Paenibacillus cymbidii TaxID=1639034 RepID=UPI00108081E0|nr:DUF2231 domain-containing protein [Paenibacillus cymbidii]
MWSEIINHVHPIIVHFPIAIIVIALFYDLVLAWRNRVLSPKQGLWLWLVAVLGAWLAVATGPEDDARGNTSYLELHSNLANLTAWGVSLLAAWRLWLILRGNRPLAKIMLIGYLFLSIISCGLVLGTGYYGGKMVYTDGVGVQMNGTDVNPPKTRLHR